MQKKIIAFICFLAITLSLIPNISAFAETKVNEEDIEMMKALNIYPGGDIDSDSLIYALAGFLYDEPYKQGTAESLGRLTGMIDAGEKYKNTTNISMNVAAKYMIAVLGYSNDVTKNLDYVDLASELGITKGVTVNSKRITGEVASQCIKNMMDIFPKTLEVNKYGAYPVLRDKTLLSIKRNVEKIRGIVTYNEETSIYGKEGVGKGNIKIGEKEYFCSGDYGKYLGKYVEAYVKEDDTDSSLLYAKVLSNKNNILTIDAKDIYNIDNNFSNLYYDNGERMKSAKIAVVPRVIFNGIYYGNYKVSDFDFDVGSIELTDNNDDGKYEIINITTYKTVVVQSVDNYSKIISNKLSYNGAITKLDLSVENDWTIEIYKDGKTASFEDIKAGQVLSVAESKDTDIRKVTVYISTDSLESSVKSFNKEENEIVTQEGTFYVTDDLLKLMSEQKETFEAKCEYVFHKDVFGNVVYVELVPSTGYALFLKMKTDNECEYYVEYMDMDEVWHSSYLCEKVTINGVKYNSERASEVLIEFEPQVVTIKENSNGEIKEITTATTTASYNKNKFTKTPKEHLYYRKYPKCFSMKLYLEDDAKVLVIPTSEDKKDIKEYYYTVAPTEFFSIEDYFDISAYDIDEYGYSHLFVVEDKAASASLDFFVIKSIAKTTIDDVACDLLMGAVAAYPQVQIPVEPGVDTSSYKNGSVVRVRLNRAGKVDLISPVCLLNDFTNYDTGNYYSSNSVTIRGTVTKADVSKGKLIINCGSLVSLKINTSISIIRYDSKEKTCTIVNTQDIDVNDKIVARINSGVIDSAIIVR